VPTAALARVEPAATVAGAVMTAFGPLSVLAVLGAAESTVSVSVPVSVAATATGEAVCELGSGRRAVGQGVEQAPSAAAEALLGERVAHAVAQPALDLAEPVSGRGRGRGVVRVVDVRHRGPLPICMYLDK
jgi:hypothetical protein